MTAQKLTAGRPLIFMSDVYLVFIEKADIRPEAHVGIKWILLFIEVGIILKELMQCLHLI